MNESQKSPVTYTVDAATFARAWLSVALASGKDETLPTLDKTVALEAHADGLLIVATDRYVLLRAWIPSADNDLAPAPSIDELPEATFVAADPHGRAKGLLGHVLKLHSDADTKPGEIVVELGMVEPDDGAQGTFEGLDYEWAVLSYPNQERLRLKTVQSPFPEWRGIVSGLESKQTRQIALNPEIIARLSKLGRYWTGPLLWDFGGAEKAARIGIGQDGGVEGVVMPVRVGFEDDETS